MNLPTDPPRVPHPTEFEDLTRGQQEILQNVSRLCLRKIAEAKNELNRALVRPVPRVATHFKILDLAPPDRRDIQAIIGHYNRMAGILLGHERLRFDGEATGPAFNLGAVIGIKAAAYVSSRATVPLGTAGEVKLVRSRFFGSPTDQQARIVIHEIGHRFLGFDDVKYYGGSRAIQISREGALRNADTYANFAVPRPGAPSLTVNAPT